MELPGRPEGIQRTARAIATLDLILSPDWEYRYYSYDSRWSEDEEMASMRNGSGDEWFVLFLKNNWCGLKGLGHESTAAQVENLADDVRKILPGELSEFNNEPAFRWDGTSFCYWYDPASGKWTDAVVKAGYSPELTTGARELLQVLGGDPAAYHSFAEEYFEVSVPRNIIDDVYALKPLTSEMVHALSGDVDIHEMAAELAQIGYPRA